MEIGTRGEDTPSSLCTSQLNPWEGGPGHAGILLRKKSINSTYPHWQGPILWQYAPPPGHAQQEYTRL